MNLIFRIEETQDNFFNYSREEYDVYIQDGTEPIGKLYTYDIYYPSVYKTELKFTSSILNVHEAWVCNTLNSNREKETALNQMLSNGK